MKNKLLGVLTVIVISSIAVASALSMYSLVFPQQIIIPTNSSSPIPENGAVTLAFDDGNLDQYQYAFPLMKERGMVGTFYVVLDWIRDISGWDSKMGSAELLDLQAHGCEIASHSKTHPYFTNLSDSQIREECASSKEALESYGLRINNFAYPYGKSNAYVNSIVDDYYRSGRYGWGIMQFPVSTFVVRGWSSYDDSDDFTPLKQVVDEVCEKKGWTIIYFHAVKPNISKSGTTRTEDFEKLLDYIMQKGVAVITVNQGLDIDISPESDLKIKVYSDPELSNEVSNGTVISWGQGRIGKNYKSLWIKNVGAVPIKLNLTLNTLPTNWTLIWDYTGQPIGVGETLKVVFTLNVSLETREGTYEFGPLWITTLQT